MNWRNMLRRFLRWGLSKLEIDASSQPPGTQKSSEKLTREEVLQMIKTNDGARGLDLSGRDLSRINLEGIDLSGANLSDSDLSWAKMNKSILRGTTLRRVIATAASFEDAVLNDADLQEAKLWNANLRGAWFRGAVLSQAILLAPVERSSDTLKSASLVWAKLDNTLLTRLQLGSALKEELEGEYVLAKEAYLNLKNNFNQIGRYTDASWAYQKERQMEKAMHAPWRARRYYGDELPKGCAILSWRWWWFHLRHTAKWVLDWAAELSCGYGEKPLRTLLWAGGVLLVFPFLFRWSGGIASGVGRMTWLDYFNYSFGAFTTIGFNHFQAKTSLAQTLTSVEALLGISVLALLMFALGNRISRS